MFDPVMRWLSLAAGNESGEFKDDDVRLATAAPFYHITSVDGLVKKEEC